MGLTQRVRSLFSQEVRRRGERYAALGAVQLVDYDNGWAEFEVAGSRTSPYFVRFESFADGELALSCTCPHFEGGDYCKHLWAATQFSEERGLFESVSRAQAGSNHTGPAAPRTKSSTWQTLLDRGHAGFSSKADLGTPASSKTHRRVFYLLEVISSLETPVLSLFQQTVRKNGEWGTIKPLKADHRTLDEIDCQEDRVALGVLLGNQVLETHYDSYSYYNNLGRKEPTRVKLVPELYATVIPLLCATGRFVWLLSQQQGLKDAPPLSWEGDAIWKFQMRAKIFGRKPRWNIQGELVQGKQIRPLSDAVHCFSSGLILMDDKLARFEAPKDFRWVEMLRANDDMVVPKKDHGALIGELWRSGEPPEIVGDPSISLPNQLGSPVGRLVVHPQRKPERYSQNRHFYASLGFLYDGLDTTPDGPTQAWLSDDGSRVIRRNVEQESRLVDRLRELQLEPNAQSYLGDRTPGHYQLAPRTFRHAIETLVAENWVVEAEGARIRKSHGMSVSLRSGVDWFDLEGQADFGGTSVELPAILAALQAGEKFVRLDDGSQGMLPEEWLDRYGPIADLSTKQEDGVLRFQPGQALLLDSLLAAHETDVELRVDRKFAGLRKRLRSFAGIQPAKAPKAFHGELRDYQREGLGWLRFLEKFSFGGCLADDMGLGKTVQVLALLADRQRRQPKHSKRRPSLVVAPKSLVHNWRLEAQRFSPNLTVVAYTGTDRKTRVPDFSENNLVLTTYGTLRKDIRHISETTWDYVVLDEAQAIKNAASQSAKACRLLDARHRLALSGTPVENHLGELWSIFEFLNPGFLGKSETLTKLTQSKTEADDSQFEALRKGLAPFLLRRTKKQVLPQLPRKTEQILYCDLPAAQRKQYNQLRDHYRTALSKRIETSGLAKSKIQVLEALLRLRQAACHPGLIDRKQAEKPSAKLDLLITQLREVVGEGHKVLVFSQFTALLAIVKSRLDKAAIIHEYLDGKTHNRQGRIEHFQTDTSCPVFLISLKAGGSGLNLTAADFVFLLDPWWNPAVEAQAIDRVHRIGQTKPVFAYRLIARDTVEEKIIELQARKSKLAEAIISANQSLLKSLSADDLKSLLS